MSLASKLPTPLTYPRAQYVKCSAITCVVRSCVNSHCKTMLFTISHGLPACRAPSQVERVGSKPHNVTTPGTTTVTDSVGLDAGLQVDGETPTFLIYLQPGLADGQAQHDASAGQRPSINRAGQGLGLQVFPGSVTQVTHVSWATEVCSGRGMDSWQAVVYLLRIATNLNRLSTTHVQSVNLHACARRLAVIGQNLGCGFLVPLGALDSV